MDKFICVSKTVREATNDKKPVVALESTIVSHGMPYPQNMNTAFEVEKIIKKNGVIPATVGVIKGRLKIGLSKLEIEEIATNPQVIKLSKSNLHSGLIRNETGSTTVASTLIACKLANIEFFATGGIGGVHRNIDELDVSADLFELAQGNCTVVCSGPKAILDVPKTIEILEAFGIPVITFKNTEIPNFWSQNSGILSSLISENVQEIAKMHNLKKHMKINGCQLVLNPISSEHQIESKIIEPIIGDAIKLSKKKNIKGRAITPFILKHIGCLTKGKSLETNIELIKSNAALAAEIAKKACKITH